MTVRRVLLHRNPILRSCDPPACYPFKRYIGSAFERPEGARNGILASPGIRQSAHQHVATDPGKRVQIASKGHDPFIVVAQGSGLPGASRYFGAGKNAATRSLSVNSIPSPGYCCSTFARISAALFEAATFVSQSAMYFFMNSIAAGEPLMSLA